MTTVNVPVPPGVDKDTARRAAIRAMNDVATIGLVEKVLADSSAHVGPGHLAQAALREERWRDVEREGGMLAADQVALLTGARLESARSHTSNLRRRKGLAGVKRRGGLLLIALALQQRSAQALDLGHQRRAPCPERRTVQHTAYGSPPGRSRAAHRPAPHRQRSQ